MYKKASRLKLRFQTTKGSLSTEQLWDLSLQELDVLAVSLDEESEKSTRKSFLVKRSNKNEIAKLKFDIVEDILNTKVAEQEEALAAKEKKEHNQKILEMIQAKKEKSLLELPVDELEKLLK